MLEDRISLRTKLKAWYGDYKWHFTAVIWLLALLLGYFGFKSFSPAIGQKYTNWDLLYCSLRLFLFNPSDAVTGVMPGELQVARFLAPAVTALTTFETLAFIFRDQIQMVRLRFMKDHIVICGLGRKGFLLSENFLGRGDKVVVIETDESNALLRQCRDLGAIVLVGDAANSKLLSRAGVDRARFLISVCGNDGVNAEVAVHSRELVSHRRGRSLTCLVHIVDPRLCHLLRDQQIQMGKPDMFRLEFFNVYESGAKILLSEYPPFLVTSEVLRTQPHLLVVGVGRLGESLVVNTARKWRDSKPGAGERLRITLVDRNARGIKESLLLRYPQMKTICELADVQMDVQSTEFEKAEFLFDRNNQCDINFVYVCLDNDSNSLAVALQLSQRLIPIPNSEADIPIVVRMAQDSGLATLLQAPQHKLECFSNIHPFALFDRTCTSDLLFGCTFEILARAFHEEYVLNEMNKGNTPEMNYSMVSWDRLSEDLKESNRKVAEYIPVKLRSIDCAMAITTDWDAPIFEFSPREVESLAEMEHERWIKEKRDANWRYAPGPRDTVKKTSPLLVPWSDLPETEKDKDRVPQRNLALIVAKAGYQIYRIKPESGE